jgi:hypothetical protein
MKGSLGYKREHNSGLSQPVADCNNRYEKKKKI